MFDDDLPLLLRKFTCGPELTPGVHLGPTTHIWRANPQPIAYPGYTTLHTEEVFTQAKPADPVPPLTLDELAALNKAFAAASNRMLDDLEAIVSGAYGVPPRYVDPRAVVIDGEIVPPAPRQLPPGACLPVVE